MPRAPDRERTAAMRRMADALRDAADAIDAGKFADDHLFRACLDAETVCDDGEFIRLREVIGWENGWDSLGYPVNEHGFRVGLDRFTPRPLWGPWWGDAA